MTAPNGAAFQVAAPLDPKAPHTADIAPLAAFNAGYKRGHTRPAEVCDAWLQAFRP